MRANVLRRLALASTFGTVVATAFAVTSCRAKHEPVVHQVAIRAMQFEPSTLEVSVGDTVVWTNEDLVPHTVTAAGSFDSQSLTTKQTWSYTASKAGEYAYGCTFHPTMKGTLTVR
jgi:plastocyanin